MPDFRVDSIYDIASLQAEQDKFMAFLADSKAAIVDLNSQRIGVKTSDVSSFTQASQNLNATIAQSTTVTQKATIASKQLTAAQIESRLATQLRTASIKNDIIENKSALGSYEQLQATLKRLTVGYRNMSAAQRESAEGKQVQQSILDTKNVLKSLDAGVGDFQRNVGNYTGGITKAFSKAYSGLRKLANLLPNFGISTAILLLSEPIIAGVKALIKWSEASTKAGRDFTDLQERIKNTNAVVEKSVSAFESATAQVSELTEDVKLAKEGFISKDEVVKRYNETMGKTSGTLKTFDEVEQKIVDDGPDYIKLMFLKAEATSAYALAAEAARKILTAQQDAEKDFGATDFAKTNVGTFFKNILNGPLNADALAESGIKAANQVNKNAAEIKIAQKKAFDDLQKQGDEFSKQAAMLAKGKGWDLFTGGGTKSRENKDKLIDSLNTEFDIYKIAQEAKIRLLDKGTKDESVYYLEKLQNLDEWVKAEKELLDRSEQNEIDKAEAAAKKQGKGQSKSNLAIIQENLEQQVLLIQAKYADLGNGIEETAANTRTKIVIDNFKKDEDALKDHISILKQLDEQRLNSLLTKSNKNENEQATILITDSQVDEAGKNAKEVVRIEADLQQKLNILEKQGQLERLEINNAGLEADKAKWEAFAALAGEANSYELAQVEDIEAKITENKRKEAELRKGIVTAEVNYEIQKRDELLDKVLQGESALLDTIQAFGDASFQRQADDAQKKENLLDEQTQREIELVNASVATEQEKADKIAIINARAAAEKALLDKQQRKADHDKAVFDKQIAILQIIAQIAVDIAKGQFFTAALAGAALIKLIATPVPAYKHGRGFGKDEMALVGDGGVSEYIMREGGQIEKTPAVNTLTHLMPKDRVLPNKQALMKELMLGSMQLSNYSVGNDEGITKNDIERMTNRIEQAVNGIKVPPSTQITKQGWRMVNEKNAKYDNWVNNKIKG